MTDAASGDELEEMHESMHDAMNLDGDVEKLAAFYDNWASTYDADLENNYALPSMIVETLKEAIASDDSLAHLRTVKTRVVDAGCGTGATGQQLHNAGWRLIRGLDLSTEMIKVAEARGVYTELEGGVDLSEPVPQRLARCADIVAVAGVFTVGHVPPEALRTMATLVQHQGVLVISTRAAYLEETNFVDYQQKLIDKGVLELLLRVEDAPYTMDSRGDYWAWRVR